MKSFLKMLLASIFGGAILIFILFIFFASLASIQSPELEVKDNTVLKIDLNAQFVERAQNNPFESFNPIAGQIESATGLDKIIASLKAAKDDPKISGVYLEGGFPMAGNATLLEMREALVDFKSSGKFIYGYSEILTQKGLFLASVADTFFVNPQGILEFSGLSASVSYYQKAMEKLGVKPVVIRATGNKFKSAVEPFLGQEMTDANRLQLTELLNSVWSNYLADLSESTGLSAEELNSIADSVMTSPLAAAKLGLIKATAYEDEVQEHLAHACGKSSFRQIDFISPKKYGKKFDLNGSKEYNENRVAVIVAQGEINSGEGNEYTIGSDRVARAIRKARLDDKVKAIVLRVNSPGGSALASEVIWREMALAREVKPVMASMGDVAASGGYYIACNADSIFAQENTVTGSIGAFGLFFTAEELMNEKLGINIETVKTNKYSDLGTLDRDLSPAENRIMIAQIDRVYGTFIKRVADGRGMTVETVDSLGQGRVYSGADALELGLVDVLGGINDAINAAANKAGLENYSIVSYPEMEDPFQKLIEDLSESMGEAKIKAELGQFAYYLELLEKAQSRQGMQTRMEFDLQID